MLFVMTGAKAVYGEVMSEKGKAVLEENGIYCYYGTLVPKIKNRKGDGECPMEMAVKDVSEPKTAFLKIKERLIELINSADNTK